MTLAPGSLRRGVRCDDGMLKNLRGALTALLAPVVSALIRLGVSPDAVTVMGTVGVCAASLWLFPAGHLMWGAVVVGTLVSLDAVDGAMARRLGRSTPWGAFLDSTADRVADAAVFAGVMWWCLRVGEPVAAGCTLVCLVLGGLVSYARARAEGLGYEAAVGIAERPDRLVVVLVAIYAVGAGAPVVVLTVALAVLAAASAVTVGQRVVTVYRQSR